MGTAKEFDFTAVGGLADAFRPGQQPGVVQPAAAARLLEGDFGGLVSLEIEDLAGVGGRVSH